MQEHSEDNMDLQSRREGQDLVESSMTPASPEMYTTKVENKPEGKLSTPMTRPVTLPIADGDITGDSQQSMSEHNVNSKEKAALLPQDTAVAQSVEIKAGQDSLHLFIVLLILGIGRQDLRTLRTKAP